MTIFVTVATHEQPFDRLISQVEKAAKKFSELTFVVQYGYSKKPIGANIKAHQFLKYDEMEKAYEDADCVISHAGPASIFDALHVGITPIIVPRYETLNEHVNNHQVLFTEFLVEKKFPIIPIFENDSITPAIQSVLSGTAGVAAYHSNKNRFNNDFQNIISRLME